MLECFIYLVLLPWLHVFFGGGKVRGGVSEITFDPPKKARVNMDSRKSCC